MSQLAPAKLKISSIETLTKVVAAIPCFNTQKFIAAIVTKAQKYVDEVIVVDDGSSDATAEVAKNAGAIIVSHGINKGYGEAMKSCFQAAQAKDAEILVILDGDGQHDPEEIPCLIEPIINKEADLVIGSRFITNGNAIPKYRKFGINIINLFWNFGSKMKVSDAQSGFRAYSQKLIKELRFSEKGMSASIEILEKIKKKKLIIKEIPITCSYKNNNSSLTFKAFRHGIHVALSVLRIRIRNNLA